MDTLPGSPDPAVESFIATAPKVELHLHLVGSASAATLTELAERHPEVTVTPVMHEMRGLAPEGLVEGLDDGRRRAAALGVELAWIYDIPGEHGQPAAERTLHLALEQPPDGLVGFGLAGAEEGVARPDDAWAFEQAIAAGMHSVPHAGEGDGPHSVRAALHDLRAERIGHGVRAVEDPALVAELAARRVPLEVCPSSNVCTRVFERLDDHPVAALVEAGVIVTVNTDDPHMFGTDLSEEYRRLSRTFGFGVPELAALVVNGIEASFLPSAGKRTLVAEVARVAAG